jgi:hypothetical protein
VSLQDKLSGLLQHYLISKTGFITEFFNVIGIGIGIGGSAVRHQRLSGCRSPTVYGGESSVAASFISTQIGL